MDRMRKPHRSASLVSEPYVPPCRRSTTRTSWRACVWRPSAYALRVARASAMSFNFGICTPPLFRPHFASPRHAQLGSDACGGVRSQHALESREALESLTRELARVSAAAHATDRERPFETAAAFGHEVLASRAYGVYPKPHDPEEAAAVRRCGYSVTSRRGPAVLILCAIPPKMAHFGHSRCRLSPRHSATQTDTPRATPSSALPQSERCFAFGSDRRGH